jgi:hypothetical protein
MALDQFDLVRCRHPLPAEPAKGSAVLEGMQGVILGATPDCMLDHGPCYRVWFEDGTNRFHMEDGDLEPAAEEQPPDGDSSVVGCLAFLVGVVVGAIVTLILVVVL